jgi:alanyl-tRNA synthetase
VRVLAMGRALEADGKNGKAYSVELCGGTHVRRLGDIGLFTVVSESAVAAGVRRIEALTSEGARHYLEGQAEAGRAAASVLRTSLDELPARLSALVEERRRLERELGDAKKALALAGGSGASQGDTAREVNGVKAILKVVEGVAAKDLKALADDAKAKLGSGVVAFVTTAEGKASLVVGVTQDLTARFNAVDLVRAGAEALGGKGGGGRPDMAQAGGPDTGRAAEALKAIESRINPAAA